MVRYSQPSGPKWTAFGAWFSRERGSPVTKSVRLAGLSKSGPFSRVNMPESTLTWQVAGDWLKQKRGSLWTTHRIGRSGVEAGSKSRPIRWRPLTLGIGVPSVLVFGVL